MHQYLADVLAGLDVSRAALRDAYAAIPEPLRDRRPAADRWSAVEVIEHLSLVESRFCAAVGASLDEALRAGLGAEDGTREPLPRPAAQAMGNREVRRNAPDPMRPTGTLDERQSWAAAERAREAFRDMVTRGDGLALSTVRQAHHSFGALTVYQWIELIAAHETRHAAQLRDIAEQLAGQVRNG